MVFLRIAVVVALCCFRMALAYEPDPRLAIDSVRDCVDQVKNFLRSDEYVTEEQNRAIVSACRDTEAKCVTEIGNSLSSFERAKAAGFLPLVQQCKGKGTGQCFHAVTERVPSYERNELGEVSALLKKCE